MSDAPNLTVPELEALLVRCEPYLGRPDINGLWAVPLAQVCRQALAQAAEIGRLRDELRSIEADARHGAHSEHPREALSEIEGDARAALAKESPC